MAGYFQNQRGLCVQELEYLEFIENWYKIYNFCKNYNIVWHSKALIIYIFIMAHEIPTRSTISDEHYFSVSLKTSWVLFTWAWMN